MTGSTSTAVNEIKTVAKQMMDALKKRIRTLSAVDYLDAKRFLESLIDAGSVPAPPPLG